MRAFLVIIWFWALNVNAQEDLLTDVRSNIGDVFKTEATCLRIHDRFEKTDISGNNILRGYKGAVLLGLARHHANVFKKMGFFSDGKELLEKSIETEPENIELRFLRLTIQANLPSFLGYSENKEDDKVFVLSRLEEAKSDNFKTKVRKFIGAMEEQGKL